MIDWTRKLIFQRKESVQHRNKNVDEINIKLEVIGRSVGKIKLDEATESFVTKTKKKLVALEECSHRKILYFDGFQEETNESWEESENVITYIVKENQG